MNYLSVCSGIEAATVAWHPMGWTPVGFSEIENFPSQVLKHHYPEVPNFGDMTKFKEWKIGSDVNLLVGGTPCQSFSVAGLRKGLDDPRGNLMLTYLAIADKYRPRWLVWENVPGVLSSNGGKDFGTFLGGLAELRYGFAYRVLDAQYFGVAQRRRRVFVVGYLGDWRPAAAVLFERHSLSWHPAPSREKGQRVATSLGSGTDQQSKSIAIQGNLIGRDSGGPQGIGASDDGVMYTLTKADVHGVAQSVPMINMQGSKGNSVVQDDGPSFTLSAMPGHDVHAIAVPQSIAFGMDGDPCHTLAKENAHNAGIVQAIPISTQNALGRVNGRDDWPLGIGEEGDPAPTLTKAHGHAVAHTIGIDSYNLCETGDVSQTMKSPSGGVTESVGAVMTGMAVRRLTPVECERLQGFPDNYTNIKPKGKDTPDGPRYKALGNSMAVPVMVWIGKRIEEYERQAECS